MGNFKMLAEVFRYPYSAQLEVLREGLETVGDPQLRAALKTFLERMRTQSLDGREMLFTRTFDLNPVAAPYLGWHIWGEDFKRAAFMARLQQEQRKWGVSAEGELPDHLVPVFEYLEAADPPGEEVLQVLVPALSEMKNELQKQDPENLYLPVLAAAIRVAEAFVQERLQKKEEEVR